MKKLFITILFITIGSWATWQYLPEDIRGQAAALFGFIIEGEGGGAKQAIHDIVLPEDPVERREALIEELRENIEEVKKRILSETAVEVTKPEETTTEADARSQKLTTQDLIEEVEEIIKELEDAAQDKSTGTQIRERIIERVLPAPSAPAPAIDCSICKE